MSRASEKRQGDLVTAFTKLGPAWARWVHANLPDDAVSYPRLRLLTVLEGDPGGRTMKEIADALEVTARRATALVDALEAEGLVDRYAHPTDGRSIIVVITEIGVRTHSMSTDMATALVGAALLAVLLFPTLANALSSAQEGRSTASA